MTTRFKNYFKVIYSKVHLLFNDKILVAKNSNNSFFISTKTIHDYFRAYTFYEKEPEMLRWLDKLDKYGINDFVFFDIGANIGIYTLYVAKKYPEARIVCFEPETNNFTSLCNNIFMNKFSNVVPYQVGISGQSGFVKLNISVFESGAGAAAINDDYKHVLSGSIFKQGLYSTSLNDLLKFKDMPIPNFIKIDVDGHEKKILSGCDELFKRDEVKAVMIELEYKDKQELDELTSIFYKSGFELSEASDWEDKSNGYLIKNYLFEKKKNE